MHTRQFFSKATPEELRAFDEECRVRHEKDEALRQEQRAEMKRINDETAAIMANIKPISKEDYFLQCAGIIRQHGSLEAYHEKLDWYQQNREDQP